VNERKQGVRRLWRSLLVVAVVLAAFIFLNSTNLLAPALPVAC